MRNGTQEELDAAREDAKLIPENALFRISKNGKSWTAESLASYDYSIGDVVFRQGDGAHFDDNSSVAFRKEESEDVIYCAPACLEVIS